jgi:hypothetical protein
MFLILRYLYYYLLAGKVFPKHDIRVFSTLSFLTAFGFFIHLLLDCLLAFNYKMTWIWGFPLSFCPAPPDPYLVMALDGVFLLGWLVYDTFDRKRTASS